MKSPPLDPPVSDSAPSAAMLTGYDEQHLAIYLRLLDVPVPSIYGPSADEGGF